MSREMTDWAWQQNCEKSSHKLVLLCLANAHNSQSGLCFPSVALISEQTQLNRKTVLNSIKSLSDQGLILIDKYYGAGNKYTFNQYQNRDRSEDKKQTKPVPKTVPETSTKIGTGVKNGTGTKNGTRPVPKTVPDQYQNRDPNQELTRKEPGNKNNISDFSKFNFSSWPSLPSEGVWRDYKSLRKQKRANVTQTVINSLGKALTELNSHGFTVDQVLEICCQRGWQGLQADWVLNMVGASRAPANVTQISQHDLRAEATRLQNRDKHYAPENLKPLEEYYPIAEENLKREAS